MTLAKVPGGHASYRQLSRGGGWLGVPPAPPLREETAGQAVSSSSFRGNHKAAGSCSPPEPGGRWAREDVLELESRPGLGT